MTNTESVVPESSPDLLVLEPAKKEDCNTACAWAPLDREREWEKKAERQ